MRPSGHRATHLETLRPDRRLVAVDPPTEAATLAGYEALVRQRDADRALVDLLGARTTPALAWDALMRRRLAAPLVVVAIEPSADAAPEVDHARVHTDCERYVVCDDALGEVLARLGGGVAGVSEAVVAPEDLQDARWALSRSARDRQGPVRFGRGNAAIAWLTGRGDVVAELVERRLGSLLEYDAGHRSDLLRTLRTYLELNRQALVTADALHIHRHTLTARLARIERLTGRSLSCTADIAELWLALNCLEPFGVEDHDARRCV